MYYGRIVRLRAHEAEDLDKIMEHWNTYEMRRFLYIAIPNSRNAEKEWLEQTTTAGPWKDGSITLAIDDKKTGEFLGSVGLSNISKQNRRAEFGIAIHNPENHGKGYGTDATKVMLWVAFHVLGLNSVYLPTLSFNERGQRAYEKAGFKTVGMFRQALFTQGKLHDLVTMDILREEFMEMYPPGTFVGEAH